MRFTDGKFRNQGRLLACNRHAGYWESYQGDRIYNIFAQTAQSRTTIRYRMKNPLYRIIVYHSQLFQGQFGTLIIYLLFVSVQCYWHMKTPCALRQSQTLSIICKLPLPSLAIPYYALWRLGALLYQFMAPSHKTGLQASFCSPSIYEKY